MLEPSSWNSQQSAPRNNFRIFTVVFLLATGLMPFVASAECADWRPSIAVDVGHSPKRFGATSSRGAKEYDFNLRFASEFIRVAKRTNRIHAFLISPDAPSISLKTRVLLGSRKGTDAFLSIHHDSAQRRLLKDWTWKGQRYLKSDSISGFSLFVSRRNADFERSFKIAKSIGRRWRKLGHMPTLHHAEKIKGENRELLSAKFGVYEAPFFVVARSPIPAVLLELGVLINPREEEWLNDRRNRLRLQNGLIEALLNSLSTSGAQRTVPCSAPQRTPPGNR